MKKRYSNAKLVNEINVVPYIDVMLVLLVIFMITAPLLTQGVSVDLPKAQANALKQGEKEPIIVSVDKEGHFFLNIAAEPNEPVAKDKLINQVAAELKFKNRTVLVKGDEAVDYGKVVQAMVILQHAGASQVGLLTDEPDTLS